jgi:diaminohydroxyphosphoribosylaminopyrimidine deaminase / 5-amino-6-(5-phosphoribosylamino)uracil reductase
VQPADRQQGPRPGDIASDRHWLGLAVALSMRCPPSATAFSVGAAVVAGTGELIAAGFSREENKKDHAEEIALRRAARACESLAGATLYSSLEPCVRRASRLVTCAELTLAAGIGRVVIAWREPPLFVQGGGVAWLSARGVTVLEYPELAAAARAANRHLAVG